MVEIPRSEYLNPDDVGELGIEVTFDTEGEIQPKQMTGFQADTFAIWVHSGKQQYKWTMNKTSREAVADKYGREAKAWIGKTVKVGLVNTNVNGTLRKSIIVIDVK